ncbi:MAG TPA: hypothetical protein VGT41_03210 [Candidatus Babeliales bacterium]|nr:hypothetical protein [Candidatus Babeliales bacterium]
MNKRFLLTAFAIISVTASNTTTSIPPRKNNLMPGEYDYNDAVARKNKAVAASQIVLDQAEEQVMAAIESFSPDQSISEHNALVKVAQSKVETCRKNHQKLILKAPADFAILTPVEKTKSKKQTLDANSTTSTGNPDENSPSTSTITDSAKAFFTNKWVKRTACVLVACTICTVLFSGHNRSNTSDDEENDTE